MGSESPLSQEDAFREIDSQPTQTRQKGRQQSKRKTSSVSKSSASLQSESDNLEEMEEKIEQEILTSEESSEHDESSFSEEEEEVKPRKSRNTRSPAKRRMPRGKAASNSRSPISNASVDFKQEVDDEELVTRTTAHVVLRSGRESKPPRTLADDESMRYGRRGHRPSKQLSPQRRSARQAKHHYSFRDDSRSPPPYMNGTERSSRRQRNSTRRYAESDEDEKEWSPGKLF
jgi:hypothetical protein